MIAGSAGSPKKSSNDDIYACATSILGDREPHRALYMFPGMAAMSIAASFFIYLTHTRKIAHQKQNDL